MPLPCVRGNKEGLAVFQATADQRFALGEDVFLKTHLPVQFWLTNAGAQSIWTEGNLLSALLDRAPNVCGNRVYVLFGAAGSGKSEVMRWLMAQVGQKDPARGQFCVRIPRTDLDPVRIVARILAAFGETEVTEEVLGRWSDLRRKPVALANQLVWQALASMYESDESILPLSYRLRPIVEANLRLGFTAIDNPEQAQRPVQLLSCEQLEQVLGDSVQDASPVYEQLRQRLQEAFEQFVLGDVRLVPALRSISRRVRRDTGVRPILIIDDLVQSMNVYANDLLDYLITLEEGEWDVILGLTPAAFEWDRRGRELLTRIRELDTVDDRVIKLDLSDTTGDVSAFLDVTKAPSFLEPYLDMYKAHVGYTCTHDCPHWRTCSEVQWGQREGARLSPFNPAFVSRLWRRLPAGKGRVRHLLLAVRKALELMANDSPNQLAELAGLVDRDVFVGHPDPQVRALVECYSPADSFPVALAPGSLRTLWKVDDEGPVAVHGLTVSECYTGTSAGEPRAATGGGAAVGADPGRSAVRDWLEGGMPNKELLKPLRLGLSRFLRDVVDPGLLAGAGTAQPNGVLRWVAVRDGASIPIALEGTDDQTGILASRTLGSSAFDFVVYADARGRERARLASRLVDNRVVSGLIYEAEALRRRWQAELTEQLECPPAELAFHLYRIALALGADLPVPQIFQGERNPALSDLEWRADLTRTIRLLWEDCFLLREHLNDGHSLWKFQSRWPSVEDSLTVFSALPKEDLTDSYRLGDRPAGEVLTAVKEQIDRVAGRVERDTANHARWGSIVDECIRLSDGRTRKALLRRCETLADWAAGLLSVPQVPMTPNAGELRMALEFAEGIRPSGTGLVAGYRTSAAWAQMATIPWVTTIAQWRLDLERMYWSVCNQIGVTSREIEVPTGAKEILEGTVELLSRRQRMLHMQSRTQQVRDYLRSDTIRHLHRLAEALTAILPDSFVVSGLYKAQRQWSLHFLQRLSALERWLASEQAAVPPEFPDIDAVSAIDVHGAVQGACTWWSLYLKQLPLLRMRGRRMNTVGVLSFLEAARTLKPSSERATKDWTRFLERVERLGILDLPAFAALDQRLELPARVRECLQRLASAGSAGLGLMDVSPEVLSHLQTATPDWAGVVRISLLNHGGSDGVFHLVDGQRPGVSSL